MMPDVDFYPLAGFPVVPNVGGAVSDVEMETFVSDLCGVPAIDISDTEIEIYYLMNRDQFARPEERALHHILVGIEDVHGGNARAAARRKIDNVRARLLKSPERFAELAARFSDCSTASCGGGLGAVRRGELAGELERAAFSLSEGELSRVIESTMGFHLIYCSAISPASEQPFLVAKERIRRLLTESRSRTFVSTWVPGVMRRAA